MTRQGRWPAHDDAMTSLGTSVSSDMPPNGTLCANMTSSINRNYLRPAYDKEVLASAKVLLFRPMYHNDATGRPSHGHSIT